MNKSTATKNTKSAVKRREEIIARDLRKSLVHEILEERQNQDKQWGGQVHDDMHTMEDWYYLLRHHTERLVVDRGRIVQGTTHPVRLTARPAPDVGHRLIKIAALAMAAAEAYVRNRNRAAEEVSEL